MQYKLTESISNDNKIIYDFVGFEDWKDFVKIMDIIKVKINPDKIDYKGITDMNGYFEKDGLYVEIQYDEMIGNYVEFKGDKSEENIIKIRRWINVIFDSLIKSVGGINA
ncbi:hypothetical protein [Clostridium saccharoperbutylacetonicum]